MHVSFTPVRTMCSRRRRTLNAMPGYFVESVPLAQASATPEEREPTVHRVTAVDALMALSRYAEGARGRLIQIVVPTNGKPSAIMAKAARQYRLVVSVAEEPVN